jgi:hypothetical protein
MSFKNGGGDKNQKEKFAIGQFLKFGSRLTLSYMFLPKFVAVS